MFCLKPRALPKRHCQVAEAIGLFSMKEIFYSDPQTPPTSPPKKLRLDTEAHIACKS